MVSPKIPFLTSFFAIIISHILLDLTAVLNTSEIGRPDDKINKVPIAADRIINEPESVWVEFIQLALDYKPLNLGQGFPDFAAPRHVTDSLARATNGSQYLLNQYTRSFGHPRLVNALSKFYSSITSKNIDAKKQILVTVGAYEALFTSITAFINPGDEAIIIEPFFDCYPPMVEMAQGRPVYVPLRLSNRSSSSNGSIMSKDWMLDPEEFESKFTHRTRLLILNTPNNPLGKIYSKEELEFIANLCIKHNVLVIADEVYEQMYYPPFDHTRIATLPGMWERTITVGSAGKTFSVTGWKIGWAYGPEHLIRYAQLIHQTAIYTVATPLQEAVAEALETEMKRFDRPDNYWRELRKDLERKRDRMVVILERAGMKPIIPQGGYFMVADFSKFADKFKEYEDEQGSTNDYKFVRWLSKNKKLQGIPGSAFYSKDNKGLSSNLMRFCFIKDDATLDKLEAIMNGLQSKL